MGAIKAFFTPRLSPLLLISRIKVCRSLLFSIKSSSISGRRGVYALICRFHLRLIRPFQRALQFSATPLENNKTKADLG